MRRTPPLDELQPPPYQDDSGSPHLSCTPSELGDSKCEFSHCSNSPRCSYNKCPSEGSAGHEIESFRNKGYEEDVPSDSTAVLSPEVSKSVQSFVKECCSEDKILCLSSCSEGFYHCLNPLWLMVPVSSLTQSLSSRFFGAVPTILQLPAAGGWVDKDESNVQDVERYLPPGLSLKIGFCFVLFLIQHSGGT